MSIYEIDKGIPLPPEHGMTGRRKLKYPWDKMSVGNSFAVPIPDNSSSIEIAKMILSMRTSGFNYINRHSIHNTMCVVYQVSETRNDLRSGFKSKYIRAWWMEKKDLLEKINDYIGEDR